jgi:hypothetical protein
VAVKWIGHLRHTTAISVVRILACTFGRDQPNRDQPNRDQPNRDLTVTGDHGIVVDGCVINALALVNGTRDCLVPHAALPQHVTYFQTETEAHNVIVANGMAAETLSM